LKAVKLLGRLFALPDHHMAKEYRQLYLEFLKRFTDKAVEVRLAMINCVKECLKANPSASEMSEILGVNLN
jgi:sister-chromatid-cohesion protein PDS5